MIAAFLTLIDTIDLPGFFVLSTFGENPLTGEVLRPHVHVHTDMAGTLAFIADCSCEPHRNIYISASKLRVPPPPGQRGSEQDIGHVAALVADFDDGEAWDWWNRIPCQPDWVLETSPGRFQAGFLFSHPVTAEEAKPLARGLKAFCRCDHGTGDIDHVWRIPGTMNWPNCKKFREGRVPCLVREVQI